MNVPGLRFKDFSGSWIKQEIENEIEFMSGYPFDGEDIKEGSDGIRLMRGVNISEGFIRHSAEIDRFYSGDVKPLEKYLLIENDLVIGMDGSKVGKNSALVKSADVGSLLVQRVARLRAKQKASIGFIYHHINSKKFHAYVDKVNTSSGIPHISAKQIKEFVIFFPETPEQTKIASFLTAVDEKISQLTQKCDLLTQYKKGVMQQIFSQVLRFKDADGKDFPDWENESLLQLSESGFSNGVFNDPTKVGKGYKLVNVLDMYIDSTIDEYRLSLVELSDAEFKKNKVECGDIFFTRSSLVKSGIAYSNIYIGHAQDITFDGHLIRMRPKKDKLCPIFANYLLRTPEVRKQLVARGKTATMTTIGQADIAAVTVFFPALSEQTKIANFLTAIDDKITSTQSQLAAAKQYKQGLLQQMFV